MIKALVKMNNKWAIVLDEPINLLYNHQNERTIVGRQSFSLFENKTIIVYNEHIASLLKTKPYTIYSVYRKIDGSKEAFGGRVFEIPLANGLTVHAHGDWWHSTLGDNYSEICVGNVADLKKCYVFYAYDILKDEHFCLLKEAIQGNVPQYEYWEYENILKGATIINVQKGAGYGTLNAKLIYGIRIAERDLTDYQRENRRISPADRKSKAYKKLAEHQEHIRRMEEEHLKYLENREHREELIEEESEEESYNPSAWPVR